MDAEVKSTLSPIQTVTLEVWLLIFGLKTGGKGLTYTFWVAVTSPHPDFTTTWIVLLPSVL